MTLHSNARHGAEALSRQITKAVDPPSAITIWICPACGRQVQGSYAIDEGREECTKKWHRATPEGVRYVREDAGASAQERAVA
jgi:hypothetical protein